MLRKVKDPTSEYQEVLASVHTQPISAEHLSLMSLKVPNISFKHTTTIAYHANHILNEDKPSQWGEWFKNG
jgi:hypothetical protein